MRSSLCRTANSAWERGIQHTGTGAIRLDYVFTGFGTQGLSARQSHTLGTSNDNPEPPMADDSNAFYVARKGDIIGIYKSLSVCQAQVCDPSVAVYKGYSLHKDTEEYLASHGFKDALYSMHTTHLKEDIFGTLVPCPFQQPDGLAFLTEKEPKKSYKKRPKEVMSCLLEFDGASKGNPGKAGAAAVLRNGDGSVVCCIREGLGIVTNNVAEYRALILGMEYALMKGFKYIHVQGDSQLICMQVQDLWKTKNQNMAELCKEVKRLKDMFQSFNIIHVKRGFNAVADNLACSAITLPVGEVCEDCGPFS